MCSVECRSIIFVVLEPTPQKAKSQPKRTLGILEMATKEFECSSDVRQVIHTITFKFVQNEVAT